MKKISEEAKTSIKKLIISVVAIGLFLGGVYLVFYLLGWTKISQEQLQEYVRSTGAIAPLVFILISFLQVTFVPIPGAVTILAGSYVFGAGYSFLYSYIGMMLGSIVAYLLGKLIGKPFVNWITGGQDKTDEWIAKMKGKDNVLLFFMFLFPFFPDDLLCSVAAVLPIKWYGFLGMQIITRATSIGATLLIMSGEIIPFHGWGLWVLGLIAIVGIVAFILSFKYADKINAFFSALAQKIADRFRKKNNKEE